MDGASNATANGTGWKGTINNGTASTGNWSNAANWDSTPPGGDERNLLFGQAYKNVNGTNHVANNDLNGYVGYRIIFENVTNAVPFTLRGNAITLADFSGGAPKIENQSTAQQTFDLNGGLTFGGAHGWAEINAVNAGLVFQRNSTLQFSGSVAGVKFLGSGYVVFNNVIGATDKWFAIANSSLVQINDIATTGNMYVMNGGYLALHGILQISESNALWLGGDFGTTGNQDLSKSATFDLIRDYGGQSFSGTISTVAGNTSGALRLNSRTTTGSNSISSQVFLDSDLQIQQASGGTLRFQGGAFDIRDRVLTIGQPSGSGSVIINEPLGSSSPSGGSLVVNSGTVTLQSSNNSYTGTDPSQLNPLGTQLKGGRLLIYADGSLGLVPQTAYNNVRFTDGTLVAGANDIKLDVKRNISGGARFDTNGHILTVAGVISGSRSLITVSGAGAPGTLRLTNPGNTYSGETLVWGGTLEVTKLSNAGLSSSIGTSTQVSLGSFAPATLRYVGSGDSTDRTLSFLASAGTLDASGTGPVGFTNPGQFVAANDPLTLILTGNNVGANTLRGVLRDPSAPNFWFGHIVKDGPGQWILSGTSPYTGTTTVKNGTLTIRNVSGDVGKLSGTSAITVQSGGTLLLSGDFAVADRLNSNASITISNGTLRLDGVPEGTSGSPGLGPLKLTTNATSALDFIGTSLLHFGASGNQTWTGTLAVWNWSGSSSGGGLEQLLFGTSDSSVSVSPAQLSTIRFYSDSGSNFLGTARFAGRGSGEIVPFPPLAFWRQLHGLPADGSQDLANPSRDGVSNLLKYAFNMAPTAGDLANANVTILAHNGSAGLPSMHVDTSGRLVIDFVRRKATSSPGVVYSVETGTDLARFSPLDLSTATVVSIDSTFERVSVTDPMIVSTRFGRVRVTVL